jgi:hypothetical protein
MSGGPAFHNALRKYGPVPYRAWLSGARLESLVVQLSSELLPAARLRFGHAEVFELNPDSADPVQDRSTDVSPFKRLAGRASRNFRFLLTGRLPEVEF